jgi:membrane protease YdiL (CAAX protease family)
LVDGKRAIKIICGFAIVFLLIEMVFLVLLFATKERIEPNFGYALNAKNILGYYSFEAFLSGTCEEPLFRVFAILVLAQAWKGEFKIWKINFTVAGIMSAILFTYAHIQFNILTLKITYINLSQLLTAFAVGLFYAIIFQKTKSVLIPIIAHNIQNVIMITIPYIILLIQHI